MADEVSQWSAVNRVHLNSDKCKELRVSFAQYPEVFCPVNVNSKPPKVVSEAKLLGLTKSDNLTWNALVNATVYIASKRLCFFSATEAGESTAPRLGTVLNFVCTISRCMITRYQFFTTPFRGT